MDGRRTTESMLAESGRLRTLARSLVEDENDADDLVQHAWLQAMRRPPDRPARLRNWLAAVVRNRRVQVLREDRRRERRERLAAREEATRGGGEAAERFEILRQVVGAVDQLPEPYRETILLRYFEDLSAADIAVRQGIPAATARTRLRRGLDRLRAHLDGACGGDRRGWAPLLVPFAFADRAASTAASTAATTAVTTAATTALTSTAGLAWMSTKTRIALLTLLLLATGGLAWPFLTDPADPIAEPAPLAGRSGTQTGSGTATSGREPVDGPPTMENRATESRETLRPASLRVRGQVVDRRDDGGCAGADLIAELRIGTDPRGEPMLTRPVRTDRAGDFTFDLPSPQGTAVLRLAAAGQAYRFQDRILFLRTDQRLLDGIRIEALTLDARVRGRVTDTKGHPLAGASLRTAGTVEHSTRTDPEGNYELLVDSGKTHRIWAATPGYGIHGFDTKQVAPGEIVHRDVVLDAGWRIAGRVLDAARTPIAGARVRAFHSFWETTVTDAAGRFELAHFPAAQRYQILAVRHPDFLDGSLEVQREDASGEVLIELARGAEVAGTVVGPDGRPLEAVPIYLRPDGLLNRRADAVSGRDGSFRLVADPEWRKLCAFAPGFAPTFVDVDPQGQPEAARSLRVQMAAGSTLRGRVIDPEGTPVPGIHLSLTVGREEPYTPWNELGRVAKSDRQGRFAVDDLPRGLLTAVFYATGYVTLRREITAAEIAAGETIEVVVRQDAGLAGRVVDAATGLPVRQFTVKLFAPAGVPAGELAESWGARFSSGRPFTDEAGTWTTGSEGFTAGRILGVEIHAAGYAPAVHQPLRTRRKPDPDDLITRLVRGGSLSGRVIDGRTGAPVEGAQVTLFAAARPLTGDTSFHAAYYRRRVETGGDGRFRFDDVATGPVSLLAQADGFALARLDDVAVRTGETSATPDLTLHQGVTLTVPWTDRVGATRSGVSLRLEAVGVPGENGRVWHQHTDSTGSARFANLNPGRYRILRLGAGEQFVEAVFAIMAVVGREAEQTIPLQERCGTASLSGRVTRVTGTEEPTGRPVGVAVQIRQVVAPDSDPREWLAFVVDGSYSFAALPDGTYTVQLRKIRGVGSRQDPGGDLGPTRQVEVRGATRLDLVLDR